MESSIAKLCWLLNSYEPIPHVSNIRSHPDYLELEQRIVEYKKHNGYCPIQEDSILAGVGNILTDKYPELPLDSTAFKKRIVKGLGITCGLMTWFYMYQLLYGLELRERAQFGLHDGWSKYINVHGEKFDCKHNSLGIATKWELDVYRSVTYQRHKAIGALIEASYPIPLELTTHADLSGADVDWPTEAFTSNRYNHVEHICPPGIFIAMIHWLDQDSTRARQFVDSNIMCEVSEFNALIAHQMPIPVLGYDCELRIYGVASCKSTGVKPIANSVIITELDGLVRIIAAPEQLKLKLIEYHKTYSFFELFRVYELNSRSSYHSLTKAYKTAGNYKLFPLGFSITDRVKRLIKKD